MISLPHIFPVTSHTKHVGPGSTFVAIKGQKEDGICYIPQALINGATTIIVQKDAVLSAQLEQIIKNYGATLQRVESARASLAQLSAAAYNYPAQKLRIIAITGTKGKTTCAWLLFHILKTAGHKVALLSTVKNFIMDQPFATELTTQHPDYLHAFFHTCVQIGIEYIVMEIAAQAVSLSRIDTLSFDGIIFTNFAQEHAEFYTNLNEYFAAKKALLQQAKANTPIVINADNEWTNPLAQEFACVSFSSEKRGTYEIANVTSSGAGVSFTLAHAQDTQQLHCPALVGSFNAENIAAVSALAHALTIDFAVIQKALQTFEGIPGRLTRYQLPNGTLCFIDYAHNPSSFQAVLPLLKSLTQQLTVVFGCGGDRDRTKRPLMGAAAVQWADLVILTTDNPRSESPQAIIEEIMRGIDLSYRHKVVIELDREKAIEYAYYHSQPQSVIALLGKGPDEYQQIGKTKFFFSEAHIIQLLGKERSI